MKTKKRANYGRNCRQSVFCERWKLRWRPCIFLLPPTCPNELTYYTGRSARPIHPLTIFTLTVCVSVVKVDPIFVSHSWEGRTDQLEFNENSIENDGIGGIESTKMPNCSWLFRSVQCINAVWLALESALIGWHVAPKKLTGRWWMLKKRWISEENLSADVHRQVLAH